MKPENLILLIPVVLLVLLTMQNRRRRRELAATQHRLLLGSRVMTGAGMFGTVVAVDGDEVTLETAPGQTSTWLRQSVVRVIEPGQGQPDRSDRPARAETSDDGQPVND